MADILKRLAEKNGLTEELYAQNVRLGAREEYPFADDETAILRKELALHREAINKLLDIVLKANLPYTEFVKYNEKIEGIKTRNKAGGV